jgi:hypothetical protein
MKATLLHQAGNIKAGTAVEVGGKTGANDKRGSDDRGGASTTSAPVYAITDKNGQTENVDTHDLTIVR